MQLTGITLPGYRLYEYLLLVNPHEELRERIMQVKKEFYDKYNAGTAIGGKPHVTLANFVQYGMMEERLINRLRMLAMGSTPFKVELKDFGSFPSHTIYINVTSKIPIQGLVKDVRKETQRVMKLNDDNKPHFIMGPLLTVARKLNSDQYDKAWLEYSQKDFTGRFIADAMLLLKRPAGEKVKFQVVKRFPFENMLVNTKQGELFG
jgi:2'-5' RNA ligase